MFGRDADSASNGVTYSPKSNNLAREFPSNILRDTIEIEDELWKSLAVMSLPLANIIQGIRRRLLALGAFHKRLPFPISRRNELLLKRARVGIIRSTREEPRFGALLYGGSAPRGRTGLVFRGIHDLLLRRGLAVWNLDLS